MESLKIKDTLLKRIDGLEVYRGRPEPLGSRVTEHGINFAIFAKHATSVTLVLFTTGVREEDKTIEFHPRLNRTGDVWHALIRGLDPQSRYAYVMSCNPNDEPHINRYNPGVMLLDPYAKALSGASQWGKIYRRRGDDVNDVHVNTRRSIILDDDFNWGYDQPLEIPLRDSIIYEVHVRGFTRHPSSGVKHPGTFAGLIEKIPYLKDLGVTAVELLPIAEFEEMDTDRINPITGERLLNFWGYQPISFFAPKASYAACSVNGGQVKEFKAMVKTMHKNGIEVILDVVFNHTGEGNEMGPTFSFKGIDNSTYYIVDPRDGHYHNYSGCGNTLNCNHPVVRNMILSCLRYWVSEMHVDGFRFDLASILGRGRDGSVLSNPPLLERIAADPILANTKLIAEAWDAAGLYQVGTFPNWGRWAEWNGRFRDDVRRFVRAEAGLIPALALRLKGSPDLYQASEREPYHSINFVTCHDGFTLYDLVSYDYKHNEANGEGNRDGTNDNTSWNCGWEGPTELPEVKKLRKRQMKNFATILFMSHGVPMFLAGDEIAHTQLGNNNAYCQDNEISWINWDFVHKNADMHRFFKLLIKFRKGCSALRPDTFASENTEHIVWHGIRVGKPDWSHDSRTLSMFLPGGEQQDILFIVNAFWEPIRFRLPRPMGSRRWFRFIDTNHESSYDITEIGEEIFMNEQHSYKVWSRSVVVLVSK
ncbi:MAG: glycogen debranching protein GlgX [Nitrospirae bacterium]|nr:glycogen debranching protein GlgX [Nitrospirota bacterium]